jgi:CTP:molybdopterin cytidylyltransferase MocA
VLFDRSTFSALLSLRGDEGGRALFSKHRVRYLPWHDGKLLVDVDTEEDYRQLLQGGAG